jgi:hypothetical protein
MLEHDQRGSDQNASATATSHAFTTEEIQLLTNLVDVRPTVINVFTMTVLPQQEVTEGDAPSQTPGAADITESPSPGDVANQDRLESAISSTVCCAATTNPDDPDKVHTEARRPEAAVVGERHIKSPPSSDVSHSLGRGQPSSGESEREQASPPLGVESLATTPTVDDSRPLTEDPASSGRMGSSLSSGATQNEDNTESEPKAPKGVTFAGQQARHESMVTGHVDEEVARRVGTQRNSPGLRNPQPASDPSHIEEEERQRRRRVHPALAVPLSKPRRFKKIRTWTKAKAKKMSNSSCAKFFQNWFLFKHKIFYRNRPTPAC